MAISLDECRQRWNNLSPADQGLFKDFAEFAKECQSSATAEPSSATNTPAVRTAASDRDLINRALTLGYKPFGMEPRTLAAATARVGGPLVGGTLGSAVAPGPGTVGGEMLGAAGGELLAQLIEGRTSPAAIGAQAVIPLAASFVPGGTLTAQLLRQAPLRAVALGAARGAIQGAGSGELLRRAEGTPTTLSDVGRDVALGGLLGSAGTSVAALAQGAATPTLERLAARSYRGPFPDTPEFIEQSQKAAAFGRTLERPSETAARYQMLGQGPSALRALENMALDIKPRLEAVEQELATRTNILFKLPPRQRKDIAETLRMIAEKQYPATLASADSRAAVQTAMKLRQRLTDPNYTAADALETKRFIDANNPVVGTDAPAAEKNYNKALRENGNWLRVQLHKDKAISPLLTEQENLYRAAESSVLARERSASRSGEGQLQIPTTLWNTLTGGDIALQTKARIGRNLQAMTGKTPGFTPPPRRPSFTELTEAENLGLMRNPPPPEAPPPPPAGLLQGFTEGEFTVEPQKLLRKGSIIAGPGPGPAGPVNIFTGPGIPPTVVKAPGAEPFGPSLPQEYFVPKLWRLGRVLPEGKPTIPAPTGEPTPITEGSSVLVPAEIVDMIGSNRRRSTQGLYEPEQELPIFGGRPAPGSPEATSQGMPTGGGTIRLSRAQAESQLSTVSQLLKTEKFSAEDRDILINLAKDLKTFLKETR